MEKAIHYLNRLLRAGGDIPAPVLLIEMPPTTRALVPLQVTAPGGGLSPPGLVQKVTKVGTVLPASSLLSKKTRCGYFAAWLDMKAMQQSSYVP